jgi:hypothetical protein
MTNRFGPSLIAVAATLACQGDARQVDIVDAAAPDAGTDAEVFFPDTDAGPGCAEKPDCLSETCRQGDLDLVCQACVDHVCLLCRDASDCQALEPVWNACTEDAECVECEADEDCQGNPNALGPTCDTEATFCVCVGDDDCLDNPNGTICVDDQGGYCGCASDADCAAGTTCITAGGLDTCREGDLDGGVSSDAGPVDAGISDASAVGDMSDDS